MRPKNLSFSVDELAILETCLDLNRYERPLPTRSYGDDGARGRVLDEWIDEWEKDRRARDILACEVLRLRAALRAETRAPTVKGDAGK